MTQDTTFRLALFVILLISGGIGVYHRRKAESGESLPRREEGVFLLVSLRVTGSALLTATLVWLIQPGWLHWASFPLPVGLRWSGAVLAIPSLGLMYATLATLGGNLTDTVVTRRNHTLVVSGPYRYLRHPYYTTTLLLVVSAFLLSANLVIGGVGLVVFILLVLRTPIEERKLIDRFGSVYEDYMRHTARYVPRLRSRHP